MFDRKVEVRGRAPAVNQLPSDVEYHTRRAGDERAIAQRSVNAFAAEVHLRLAELHFERAQTLQAVRRGTVGNVHPFRR